jgi:hypothetical protein
MNATLPLEAVLDWIVGCAPAISDYVREIQNWEFRIQKTSGLLNSEF